MEQLTEHPTSSMAYDIQDKALFTVFVNKQRKIETSIFVCIFTI